MKFVKRSKEVVRVDINAIAKSVNLHPIVVSILADRRLDSVESINQFVFGVDKKWHDPFLLYNMRAVIDRLLLIKKNNEKVIIYGDYDCDGVVSAVILQRAFLHMQIDCLVHIPKRNIDGYGLNCSVIEKLIEEHNPALFITCDCGISAIKEVEHCLNLGVDIIVTDHHEPGVVLPSCLIVNPKLDNCKYPDKNLCGAGVALKVVQALCGIGFSETLVDLASVATIGDMVALVDENRLIVKKGLEKLNGLNCNKGIKKLKEQLKMSKITSQDIAYKISPRINVAGRMGDAYNAFLFLSSHDDKLIDEMIEVLEKDNTKRKELCEIQYSQSLELLKKDNLDSRCIFLINTEWVSGLTGILAARLVNDFYRPSFVLTASGQDGILKGTSRSIDGINIYELLSSCKEHLLQFGGHKQAAGFSVLASKTDDLRQAIEDYLNDFKYDIFLQTTKYDALIDIADVSCELVRDIDKLEPFGIGFDRPIFAIKPSSVVIEKIKNQHSNILIDKTFSVIAFSCKDDFIFEYPKMVAVDLYINDFFKTEVAKGYLKAVEPKDRIIFDNRLAIANSIRECVMHKQESNDCCLQYTEINCATLNQLVGIQSVGIGDTNNTSDNKGTAPTSSIYGTLIVCFSKQEYDKLKSMNLNIYEEGFLYPQSNNNINKVMVALFFDTIDLAVFNKIILTSTPFDLALINYINKKTTAEVFVVTDIVTPTQLNQSIKSLDLSRTAFLQLHNAIKQGSTLVSKDITSHMRNLSLSTNIDVAALILAYTIFEQLGLVTKNNEFGYCVNIIKTDLNKSDLYKKLQLITVS